MIRRWGFVKVIFIAHIAGQLFLTPLVSAAEAPALRGVHNSLGGTMTPLFVAQELGLFAKHGLQHSLNYLPATTAVQALAAGSEEIGFVGNQCVDVALEGADTIYVAATASRFIFQLYGDPAIKSVADLKGKVIAATQPAASTDYAARIVLRRYGLTPDKDVKIIYAGSSPALMSMLKSGNAAAGLINAPVIYQAQELGMKPIVNLTELNIPFIFVARLHDQKSHSAKTRCDYALSQGLYRSDLDYPARQGNRAQDHGQIHEDGQSPVGRGGL